MLRGKYVILSIDFDYFVDADNITRTMNFPDGHEGFSDSLCSFIWSNYYPQLNKIGIKNREYENLINYAKRTKAVKEGKVVSFESHKEIYNLVEQNNVGDNCHIFNIDYHHDMYFISHNNTAVDCGNWGRVLKEKYPNFKLSWIACDDSEKELITGDFVDCDEVLTLDEMLESLSPEDVDVVFMCRSDMWTPPHLDKYYKNLEMELRKMQLLQEREVIENGQRYPVFKQFDI